MRALEALQRAAELIHRFNDYLGRVVAWSTVAMVITTFLIVVLRYGFDIGSIAVQESITYMHAVVFMAGSAYTLRHNAHVRVDVIYRNLGERAKAWVNLAGCLVLLIPVTSFILWSSWGYVATSWSLLEGSREAGGLPMVYLLKSLIPVLAVTLLLEGIAMSIDNMFLLFNGPAARVETN